MHGRRRLIRGDSTSTSMQARVGSLEMIREVGPRHRTEGAPRAARQIQAILLRTRRT